MKTSLNLLPNTVSDNSNLLRSSKNIFKKEWIWLTSIFVFFLLLRIICWAHVTKFEEPDSVWYLNLAIILKNHQWDLLTPADNLFYPFTILIFNWLGFGLEFSARLSSLMFSSILFFSIYFLGKKIIGIRSTLIALLIFSLSPFYISFSVSVLSDPTYIGLVFLGFVVFRYFLEKPNLKTALSVGIIFGFSFSDRTEGIIFLVLIPAIQLLHYIFWKQNSYSFSKLISYIILYIFGFSLIATPVIVRVSNQMGTFSISGRTVWEKLLKSQEKESYPEKLYGLDFSDSEVNLYYMFSHPEQLSKIKDSEGIYYKFQLFIYNVSELCRFQLSSLIGIFVIFFSGIGIYFMFYEKKIMDLTILLSFVLIVLIPPMWLKDYITRHIVIIGPVFILLSGFGVYRFSEKIENSIRNKKISKFFRNKISYIFLAVMVLLSFGWINKSLRYPSQNDEYSPANFSKPIFFIKEDIKKEDIVNPKVVSWHSYLPYFADVTWVVTPFTDYEGFVKYCKLNNANYFYLEYDRLKDYPFVKNFESGYHPDFKLLLSQTFSYGKKIELYKLLPEN